MNIFLGMLLVFAVLCGFMYHVPSVQKRSGYFIQKFFLFRMNIFLSLLLALMTISGCTVSTDKWEIQVNTETTLEDTEITLGEPSSSETSSNVDAQGEKPFFSVDFLDVGQGLSVLIESDGHYLLYDGGDRSHSSYVVSFLQQKGIETLDYVIASHYDADHISGLVGVLNTFEVSEFLAPNYKYDTKIYQSLMQTVEEKQIPFVYPTVGKEFSLGSLTGTILSPASESYSDYNNYSIAVRFTHPDVEESLLITGDAEYESEEEMVSSGLLLESTVYVAGHHGSGSSSSVEFLQRVLPEYVVLSCKAGNSYGHPHDNTMENLQAMEVGILRTDVMGEIHADFIENGILWSKEPSKDYRDGDEIQRSLNP